MATYYGAAAAYNKPSGFQFNKRITMFIVLGLLIIVGMTAVFALINNINSGPRLDAATLILRQQKLQEFMNGQQSTIKSDGLAKINSEAALLFTGDGTALRKNITAVYGTIEYPPTVLQAETDTASAKTLQNANLVNQFDTTYQRLLRDKIAATMSLARKVQSASSGALNQSVKTALDNLSAVDSQLAKLTL